MRRVGVITTNRADYGSYVPVLRAMRESGHLDARLFIHGEHVPADDPWPAAARIPGVSLCSSEPECTARIMGQALIGFGRAYREWRPDLLLALGDRFEMHAAVTTAVPFRIPVAHIHGGEITEGAMDDMLRHSVTKLSHLHFAAHEQYRDRILQMGEEPWRVVVSGAPAVDALLETEWQPSAEWEGCILVTFHPATLELDGVEWQTRELLCAIESSNLPALFTGTNSDPGGRVIRALILEYCATHNHARHVENLGSAAYFSAMRVCACMVGNSSSGLIEAPSLGVPVVNIGGRQMGRIRAANVIDCSYDRASVLSAIERAVSPAFRSGLSGIGNPYGSGGAAKIIAAKLASVELGETLLRKRFCSS